MEEELKEEKMGVDSHKEKLILHSSRPRKGGLRALPFIIGNGSLQKISSYGLAPNMIFYLISDYHMEAATATIVISLWLGMGGGLAIFGAFLSDSYLGRFRVIALGSFSSFLGTTLFWLTTMVPELKPLPSNEDSPTSAQLAFLFSGLILIAIGEGCIAPCSIAFGADQLVMSEDSARNERVLQRFFNWYYASFTISVLFAITILVYVQDHYGWKIGFGIPVIMVFLSALAFVFGSSLFVKVPGNKSLFTGFAQVVVVAMKKRNIGLPPSDHPMYVEYCNYHVSDESKLDAPTQTLRCLNKACVITDPDRDLNPDGSPSNAWNLCSVDQVECLKALLRIIPIWSTTFIFHVCQDKTSFVSLQAKTMDRHITSNFEVPAASFGVILIVTVAIWIAFYDPVLVPILARYTGKRNGLSPLLRMGIGYVLSFLAMSVLAVTERARRNEGALKDDRTESVAMSALWLVPAYCLLGLAEALTEIGQIEFLYSEFPKTMASLAIAVTRIGSAVSSLLGSLLVDFVDSVTAKGGKESWLSSNLNKGHLDYFYWLLAFLSLVNFVYFIGCYRAYGPSADETMRPSTTAVVDGEESDCYRSLPSA